MSEIKHKLDQLEELAEELEELKQDHKTVKKFRWMIINNLESEYDG